MTGKNTTGDFSEGTFMYACPDGRGTPPYEPLQPITKTWGVPVLPSRGFLLEISFNPVQFREVMDFIKWAFTEATKATQKRRKT